MTCSHNSNMMIVLVASLAVIIFIPNAFAENVPEWVKNTAGWWAADQIDDSSFLQGIQYLIKEGIMVIPSTETSESTGSQEVPDWIKNNAGWWADGQIDDSTFISGIQWLISNGIIIVEEKLIHTDVDFRVAFIGDQGFNLNSIAVLNLIKDEGAQMVLHQGDLDYLDDPDAWDKMISDVLGDDFPYFGTIGQHDSLKWNEYQQKLYDRLKKNPDVNCIGDLGVKSSCSYKGLLFIQAGPALKGSGHSSFIENQLNNNDHIWRICSWAATMHHMQLGQKEDKVGWEVYENCKNGAAIIATAHEHSYSRTKTLIDIENQIVDSEWSEPNKLRVKEGSTFVFVSGLGGHSIRDQERCLPVSYPYGCNGEWASIYTSDQDAFYGALFCTFNAGGQPNKAYCYFKDIDGRIIDEFTVTSFLGTYPDNTDLIDVDMSGRDLTGNNFSNKVILDTNLSNAKLIGADLSNAVLIGTILTGADLTDANLTGVSLAYKDLTGTILRGADLTDGSLAGVDLSGMDLTGTILRGADLTDATGFDFSGRDLTGTILRGVDFTDKDLTGTILRGANLANSIFAGFDFSGMDLTGTILRGADLTDATGFDFSGRDLTGTILRGVDLTGKDLSGANLSSVDLSEHDLAGTNLSDSILWETDLSGIDLSSTTLTNADFRYANLSESRLSDSLLVNNNFDYAYLMNINFAGKDLSESSFQQVNLEGSDMQNTNLRDSAFIQVDFTKIKNKSLAGADLSYAAFSYSNLSGVDLSGTFLESTNFAKADLSGLDFTVTDSITDGIIFIEATLSNSNFEGVDLSPKQQYFQVFENKAHLNNLHHNLIVKDLFGEFPHIFIISMEVRGNDLAVNYVFFNTFAHANLENANFKNADLRQVNFYSANLANADLSGADLRKTFLSGADLSNANLEGANLEGAQLTCKNHPICQMP